MIALQLPEADKGVICMQQQQLKLQQGIKELVYNKSLRPGESFVAQSGSFNHHPSGCQATFISHTISIYCSQLYRSKYQRNGNYSKNERLVDISDHPAVLLVGSGEW